MIYYRDKLQLPDSLQLDDLRALMDEVQATAFEFSLSTRVDTLYFEYEAPDLWDLHEYVSNLESIASAYGIEFTPNKDNVKL